MNVVTRLCLSVALIGTAFAASAECLRPEVEAHVREQFALYGPQSVDHEYFGFIYVHDGVIGSAVVRSRQCRGEKCVVDSTKALESIPKPATILGEWHTHPHGGSPSLSKEDVRGAYSNRHISCYLAFYSTPEGEIYAWNPNRVSVPIAMASRAPVGNYKQEQS
jgi:proteasome lid subunit RPN8/RPN11